MLGCASSHELDLPDGIAPDRRVVELSDAEWATYCRWQEDRFITRHGEPSIQCDGGGVYGGASFCIEHGRARARSDCPLTIGNYARCIATRIDLGCGHGAAVPECEIAFCPPADGA